MVVENVPMFDEHVGDDGTNYDRTLLEKIAENCNRRIQATGDHTPMVIGHTPDEGDYHDPPVVALAGPFHVAKWRNKWTILGKCWVFNDPESLKLWRTHPRRSVEVWPEDSPEKRFFDPIALLGAETPRRDLGLLYSKQTRSMRPVKYEASVGGGSNTYLPTTKLKHQKGDAMLQPEDIAQIVDALRPVMQQMIDENEAFPDQDGTDELPPELPPQDESLDAPPMGEEGLGVPPMEDEEPMPYSKCSKEHETGMNLQQKYRKQRDDYKLKYQKAEKAHRDVAEKYAKLQKKAENLEAAQKYAKRQSDVLGLREQGYIVELDEADDFVGRSDSDWEAHVDRMKLKYQRAGSQLPPGAIAGSPHYIKADGDQYVAQAKQVVQKYRKDGKQLSYPKVLNHLTKNKGNLLETQLDALV